MSKVVTDEEKTAIIKKEVNDEKTTAGASFKHGKKYKGFVCHSCAIPASS